MQKFALIGYPISHSKSPALFNAGYANSTCKELADSTYTLIECQNIKDAITEYLSEDYKGINITAPFKEMIFKPEIVELINSKYYFIPDKTSYFLQSANILIKREEKHNGKQIINSYNSDFLAVKTIINNCKKYRNIKHIAVIGLGGAGKAASTAVAELGLKLTMINRGDKTNFYHKLKENYSNFSDISYCPLTNIDFLNKNLSTTDMAIYTIPVKLDIIYDILKTNPQIVLEANYATPSLNSLYKETQLEDNFTLQKKGEYISGREWLLQQAIPAFYIFTNEKPNYNAMKKIMF